MRRQRAEIRCTNEQATIGPVVAKADRGQSGRAVVRDGSQQQYADAGFHQPRHRAKALQAPRTLLVSAANGVAVLCFIVAGVVRWPETLTMGVGALLGGYAGAHAGRRLPPAVVRLATVLVAVATTLVFFVRAYG
jgi:hypothetical protein